MIDSGFPASRQRREVDTIVADEQRGRHVYITHHHEDHAGNVSWLAAQGGIPLAMDAAYRSTPFVHPAPHRTCIVTCHVAGYMRALSCTRSPRSRRAGLSRLSTRPGHVARSSRGVGRRRPAHVFAGDLFLGVTSSRSWHHRYERSLAPTARRCSAVIRRAYARRASSARIAACWTDGTRRLLSAKADWLDEHHRARWTALGRARDRMRPTRFACAGARRARHPPTGHLVWRLFAGPLCLSECMRDTRSTADENRGDAASVFPSPSGPHAHR